MRYQVVFYQSVDADNPEEAEETARTNISEGIQDEVTVNERSESLKTPSNA